MIDDQEGEMHIGLIGGIGPAATDYYYRRLISTSAKMDVTLELTIVHADTPTLLRNLASNDGAAQTAIYDRLTNRLKRPRRRGKDSPGTQAGRLNDASGV